MNHFQDHNRTAKLADANRRKWFIAAREDKERKAQLEDEAEQTFVELAAAVIVATELQIQTFHANLDTYDEATVAALMENQELLDAVNERIKDMLSRAHKLDDGRRVFKTEDGQRVYDEHGEQLDETVIHPNQIDDARPRWEALVRERGIRDGLIQNREDIHKYQEKLDGARERSNADDFSKEELDELEAELEADMPPAVMRHISGYETVNNAPDLKTNFISSSSTLKPKKIDIVIEPAPTPL